MGVPMTTIEARLESVPEMGYDALAKVPRGEICLRGNTLFSGYHKREDLTKDTLVDGWFHTGKTTYNFSDIKLLIYGMDQHKSTLCKHKSDIMCKDCLRNIIINYCR